LGVSQLDKSHRYIEIHCSKASCFVLQAKLTKKWNVEFAVFPGMIGDLEFDRPLVLQRRLKLCRVLVAVEVSYLCDESRLKWFVFPK
jgi:hypothetical protein